VSKGVGGANARTHNPRSSSIENALFCVVFTGDVVMTDVLDDAVNGRTARSARAVRFQPFNIAIPAHSSDV
jgi:hypothetical protein